MLALQEGEATMIDDDWRKHADTYTQMLKVDAIELADYIDQSDGRGDHDGVPETAGRPEDEA